VGCRRRTWRSCEPVTRRGTHGTWTPFREFYDPDAIVRAIWRTAGRGPDSNIEFTLVFMLRRRRIFLLEYFWDHAETLELLGLSE
jgi:hypothetical protein